MLTEATDYDELYRNFRWDIPARFNIATACCDRYADGSGRLALIYVDEDGGSDAHLVRRGREMSRRFANVLKADGLVRGDRVAVFLSQSLELPIAHLAAFRSGMVSIPLFALFGEDALEFRLSNSGAKADRHRRRRLGEAGENPRPAAGPEECLRHRRRARRPAPNRSGRRSKAASAGIRHRRYLGRRSRPHHLHLGHHGKSERRAARASRACSAICPMSRCATTSCPSPAT